MKIQLLELRQIPLACLLQHEKNVVQTNRARSPEVAGIMRPLRQDFPGKPVAIKVKNRGLPLGVQRGERGASDNIGQKLQP